MSSLKPHTEQVRAGGRWHVPYLALQICRRHAGTRKARADHNTPVHLAYRIRQDIGKISAIWRLALRYDAGDRLTALLGLNDLLCLEGLHVLLLFEVIRGSPAYGSRRDEIIVGLTSEYRHMHIVIVSSNERQEKGFRFHIMGPRSPKVQHAPNRCEELEAGRARVATRSSLKSISKGEVLLRLKESSCEYRHYC